MSKKVSIIMTAYNAERYIGESIKSVLNQTFTNFELIVVNDASEDRTVSEVKDFNYDRRVKLFSLKFNKGTANGRNFGISKANGEYIAFIDSDDTWVPNKLERQITYMENNNIDFCYSYYNIVNDKGILLKKVTSLPFSADYNSLLKSNCIPLLTVILKREIIDQNRFVNIHHEDYATWLLILKKYDLKAYLFAEITANYRERVQSLSGNKIKSLMWTWTVYRKSENLGILKSFYYLFCNARAGFFKHQKFLK